jgi:hypothetical protein
MSDRDNPFTAHPHAVGESYVQHFGAAFGYAIRLFAAGGAALVHAFLPFLFEKTASNSIKAMYADIIRRGANSPISDEPRPAKIVAAE